MYGSPFDNLDVDEEEAEEIFGGDPDEDEDEDEDEDSFCSDWADDVDDAIFPDDPDDEND